MVRERKTRLIYIASSGLVLAQILARPSATELLIGTRLQCWKLGCLKYCCKIWLVMDIWTGVGSVLGWTLGDWNGVSGNGSDPGWTLGIWDGISSELGYTKYNWAGVGSVFGCILGTGLVFAKILAGPCITGLVWAPF